MAYNIGKENVARLKADDNGNVGNITSFPVRAVLNGKRSSGLISTCRHSFVVCLSSPSVYNCLLAVILVPIFPSSVCLLSVMAHLGSLIRKYNEKD